MRRPKRSPAILGANPLSSKRACRLLLGASAEARPLDSPVTVPSPTPLRRRLLYRDNADAVWDKGGRTVEPDDVILVE
jgi:hypothetical protein